MDKHEVARVLDECGTMLEILGENQFRCLAYHNGARALDQMEGNLSDKIASGEISKVRGLGTTLVDKIKSLAATGRLEFYEELKRKIPPGLIEMLEIPGFGPKKIKLVHDALGVAAIDQLKTACRDGSLAEVKGLGKKTAERILSGIEYLARAKRRHLFDEAMTLATNLFDYACNHPQVMRAELCGSLRRRKETIGDIDILASARDSKLIMQRFVSAPGVQDVLVHGPTKSSVRLETGIQADLRVVKDAEFPFALHYFTGSKQHNIRMRARAQEYGLRLNEYALAGEKRNVACQDEADIFETLELEYVPPELREDMGEIEAAAARTLPKLLEPEDLNGTFHCHTTWSDGTATIAEMAQAAKKLGYRYLGIADHSRTRAHAGGLSIEQVHEQLAEIDRLNRKLRGFRILKGIESDILADGQLDYPDKVLAEFDYVVASVHSGFNMSRADMTKRVVRAVSHPHCTMLGHPTGRVLLKRDGYELDMDAVFEACAKHQTMIEINAHPSRLDLDWRLCKTAKSRGVQLVINPDAHSTDGIAFTRYGVYVARKGWLEAADVFNCKSKAEVCRALGCS